MERGYTQGHEYFAGKTEWCYEAQKMEAKMIKGNWNNKGSDSDAERWIRIYDSGASSHIPGFRGPLNSICLFV